MTLPITAVFAAFFLALAMPVLFGPDTIGAYYSECAPQPGL
jgi:hypothetical protein